MRLVNAFVTGFSTRYQAPCNCIPLMRLVSIALIKPTRLAQTSWPPKPPPCHWRGNWGQRWRGSWGPPPLQLVRCAAGGEFGVVICPPFFDSHPPAATSMVMCFLYLKRHVHCLCEEKPELPGDMAYSYFAKLPLEPYHILKMHGRQVTVY